MGVFWDAPDELDAEPVGDALAEALDVPAGVLAAGDAPDVAEEELLPALNVAPLATGDVTETSLSAAVPRLTITIRRGACAPLA